MPILALAFFGLGAILASFAGVVAERIFTGQSWLQGRSRCDACGRLLSARDLVPILSWTFAGGRDRVCGARLPAAYPLYEAVLGGLFAAAYLRLGLAPALAPLLCGLVVLAALVIYDLRHTIVPPLLSALLALAGLVYLLVSMPAPADFGVAIGIAAAIAVAFGLVHALTDGRAMGLGDAPVAFSLALFAAPHALAGLAFSFWIGGIVGIAILLSRPKGRRIGIEVPFVPFMAAGFILAFFISWNPFPWP